MKYFLQRNGQQFGPYSLDDLRRYQSENRIGPSDMIRREDSQQWEPWQQVLNAPPATPPAPAPTYQPPAQPAFGAAYTPEPQYQQPPQQPQPPAYGAGAGAGFGGGAPGYGANPGFGGGFGASAPASPGYGAPAMGGFGAAPAPGFGGQIGPMPPDMQWWMVLVIGLFCGVFPLYWLYKEVTFVKQINPQSNAGTLFLRGLGLCVVGLIIAVIATIAATSSHIDELAVIGLLAPLFYLGGIIFVYMGMFSMRRSIHDYYNNVEPMGINLMDGTGAILTFFFGVYFFQYHFYNIAMRKKAMGHQ